MFLDFVTEVIHCGCRQVPAAGVLGCVAQAWAAAMSPLSWGVSLGSCKIAGDLECRKEETSKKSAGRLCWRVITMRSVSFYSCCSSSVLLWYAHSHPFHLWLDRGTYTDMPTVKQHVLPLWQKQCENRDLLWKLVQVHLPACDSVFD